MRQGHIKLGMPLGFRVLLAKGHRAKADFTDPDTGTPEFTLLHVKNLRSEKRGSGACMARTAA
ncbi:hypothetical protein Gxy13693_018_086 [Komagataeibacter xylinus NBRC 13693]|uniref:Uncharacterized protein n=1 Tax=Komagataeibacter xylinus NBRC 13693 TaxID=1234668 RepID=A0A0D6Q904_KOMXY|nr:hypothetical protein Gxy13693_018_086 [Komagataeibacter xylinus NBRC 13693]